MKCFLVVNQLNNPVFLDFDAEFTKFVHKRAVELGLQDVSGYKMHSKIFISEGLVLLHLPAKDWGHCLLRNVYL